MQRYDAVVVGSGHNALVAAACLARAGWGVAVLEGNDRPGGLVRTEELTLPGFRHDTYSSAHPLFTIGTAYAELGEELASFGLTYRNWRYCTGVSMPGAGTAVLSRDPEENVAEAERLAPGDGAALTALLADFQPYAERVFGLLAEDLASRESARVIDSLMREDGHYSEFAQLFLRTARDLLEHRFSSPVMHALLAPWTLHLGRGPDEANSALWAILVLLALTTAGMPTPEGGSGELARALTALIEHHGGRVSTGQWVERVLVRDGRATGVVTARGETVLAERAVIASVNPDQLYLKLLADEDDAVPPDLRRQAADYRYGRGGLQIHLALSEPPRFADERLAACGLTHLNGGLDALSRSTTEAVCGLLPADPPMSVDFPSGTDPTRCPPGSAVARIQLQAVPVRPRGDAAGEIDTRDGWTEAVKNAFADRVIEVAARHIVNLSGAILGRHVIGPDDLAWFNPNCGPGDPYAGSHELAQSYLLRPLPGQPSHRTAVRRLYMVGAATWPGHGVNGASGHIVARRLLESDD
ncbi:phytoene desaturase family protein [Streptomyces litchfieldiae]|uniref:Pyridine nucleotide-disulfide oxidoreductase domain-containing protein 2 n=1 Tax=Streptomyces litchfieldiae TaxID=3075543 RepID=A0ABU2MZ11_9ACTN|nr:NAD(P)/FAD-dependent oxidoreductase [Streptomyces sp. DSM 44938]MDT0346897.1 NAD(P)/FAD-dependent oxidoreductase [Streptomyces sp. DSM 44938]